MKGPSIRIKVYDATGRKTHDDDLDLGDAFSESECRELSACFMQTLRVYAVEKKRLELMRQQLYVLPTLPAIPAVVQ